MVVRNQRHKIGKFSHIVRKFYCSWVRNFAPVHGCEFSQKFSNFVSLTSDEHNFFVRTPFEVFLDFMESSLSQESRFMPVEDKWSSQPC